MFDLGMSKDEGLALCDLIETRDPQYHRLFNWPLRTDRGLARQLNPDALYCAMRWDYKITSRESLRGGYVMVFSGDGPGLFVKPVDWGPNVRTGRIIDLSPKSMAILNVKTDDEVTASLFV